jgi:hypothetical protein
VFYFFVSLKPLNGFAELLAEKEAIKTHLGEDFFA